MSTTSRARKLKIKPEFVTNFQFMRSRINHISPKCQREYFDTPYDYDPQDLRHNPLIANKSYMPSPKRQEEIDISDSGFVEKETVTNSYPTMYESLT